MASEIGEMFCSSGNIEILDAQTAQYPVPISLFILSNHYLECITKCSGTLWHDNRHIISSPEVGTRSAVKNSTVISVNMPPPLDVKGGIITENVFPVFSESFFGLVLAWSCTFGS